MTMKDNDILKMLCGTTVDSLKKYNIKDVGISTKERATLIRFCKAVYIKFFRKRMSINNPLYKTSVRCIGLDIDPTLLLERSRRMKNVSSISGEIFFTFATDLVKGVQDDK